MNLCEINYLKSTYAVSRISHSNLTTSPAKGVKNLSIFFYSMTGGNLVQQSGMVSAILIGGSPKRHSCEIVSKSVYRFCKDSCLKVFLFSALAASLFWGAQGFEQFW